MTLQKRNWFAWVLWNVFLSYFFSKCWYSLLISSNPNFIPLFIYLGKLICNLFHDYVSPRKRRNIWIPGISFDCRYPYNNFLHHHVEHIVMSCLGSKSHNFVDHLLHECNLVGKMLDAEKNFTLTADESKVICYTFFVFDRIPSHLKLELLVRGGI